MIGFFGLKLKLKILLFCYKQDNDFYKHISFVLISIYHSKI